MPIPPKINFIELNVPNDYFTENTRTTENRFSQSILPKVFYPNGVKFEKYLLKNFGCGETGKTNYLFKEIDFSEQILCKFIKKKKV